MVGEEEIRVELSDGVKTITIDKPKSRNALSSENARFMAEEIEKSEMDGTRVIVVTGAGGAFSSGAELNTGGFQGRLETRGGDLAASLAEMLDTTYHKLAWAVRSVTLPVIASVDGVAAGVAFSVVLASDLVLASTRSRFLAIFVRIALMPDGGMSFLLPRIVGMKRAMEMALTGDAISAEEAASLGIVNRLYPAEELREKTMDLARRLARGPKNTLAAVKGMFHDAETIRFEETLREEARRQSLLMTHENCLEGVAAFFEKRPAKYR